MANHNAPWTQHACICVQFESSANLVMIVHFICIVQSNSFYLGCGICLPRAPTGKRHLPEWVVLKILCLHANIRTLELSTSTQACWCVLVFENDISNCEGGSQQYSKTKGTNDFPMQNLAALEIDPALRCDCRYISRPCQLQRFRPSPKLWPSVNAEKIKYIQVTSRQCAYGTRRLFISLRTHDKSISPWVHLVP